MTVIYTHMSERLCYANVDWAYFVVHVEILEETLLLGSWHLDNMARDQEGEDQTKRKPHY